MDYYERLLYNQIVGSLNAQHYQTTYHYALGLNASKPWGNETPHESCCGGTGSENHVKYQEAAYFVSDNTLWVGLFLPSIAHWEAQGVTISQECAWPAEASTIRIMEGNGRFAMKIRVPYWATSGYDVQLNDTSIADNYQPSSYVTIPEREWTTDDVVTISMPFSKHIDYAPDKMNIAMVGKDVQTFSPQWAGTLMLGPMVMAATGFQTWEEATLSLSPDLHEVTVNRPTQGKGADAHLYSLSVGGHTFYPDYYIDKEATHYFRLAQ